MLKRSAIQLFELKLRELEEGEIKLGRVTISYDAIQGEKIKKVENVHEIVIQVVPAAEFKKKKPDKEVEKLVLVQQVRVARKQALELADQGKFDQARQILEEMAAAIKASRTKDEELLDLRTSSWKKPGIWNLAPSAMIAYTRKGQMSKMSSAMRSSRSHVCRMICITAK